VLASALLLTALSSAVAAQDPADDAWKRGDLAVARQLYAERLAEDSTDVLALHRMALMLAWDGQHSASLTLLDKLLAVAPEHEDAQLDRARILAWAGQFDESLDEYDGLLTRVPGHRRALLGMAQTLSWTDDLDSAQTIYRRLIEADSADIEARQGLARTLAWQGKLGDAEWMWRSAAALAPENPTTLIGLSQTLRWQGRPDAARAVLDRVPLEQRRGREYLEERRWLNIARGPNVAPSVTYEFDSDDNDILTIGVRGTYNAVPRLRLGLHTYYRHATWNRQLLDDRHAWGVLATGRYFVEAGWVLGAGVGVAGSNGADASTEPSLELELRSPARLRLGGTIAFRRAAFDATALMIERGVTAAELGLGLRAEPAALWQLEAGAGYASFNGSEPNRRLSAYVAGTRRLTDQWAAAARIRTFGFEKNLDDGYFDPDFYGHGELIARWRPLRRPWSLTVEAAPGLEQVSSPWNPKATVRLALQASYDIGPGRSVGLATVYSNAGLQSFATGEAGYRYFAITLSGNWAF
jgi:tetratricopeptide (TPR) repeat protein